MIPAPLTLTIPAIAVALVAWLRDAALPRWLNYVILIAFFVAAVAASIALSGGLTGDANKDSYIIIGVCAAVFALLKGAMDKATPKLPSPLRGLARRSSAASRRDVEAAWRASRAKVPPRATSFDKTLPGIARNNVEIEGRWGPSLRIVDGTTRPMPSVPPTQPPPSA